MEIKMIKALSRLKETAGKGADKDIQLALYAALSIDVKTNFTSVKNYTEFSQFIEFCRKVEVTLASFGPPMMFVGASGIVSSVSKKDNIVEFDPKDFKQVLVKLNKLGFPFKKNGEVAVKRLSFVTIYSHVELDKYSIGFSLQPRYVL